MRALPLLLATSTNRPAISTAADYVRCWQILLQKAAIMSSRLLAMIL
jgi:hypothetical protein